MVLVAKTELAAIVLPDARTVEPATTVDELRTVAEETLVPLTTLPAATTVPAASVHRCGDRKSIRLNSSHSQTSYAVFCLKKKIDASAIAFARLPLDPRIRMIVAAIIVPTDE